MQIRSVLGTAAAIGACAGAVAAVAPADSTDAASRYVVVLDEGTTKAQAARAVEAAGGELRRFNAAVDVATATSSDPSFADRAARQDRVSATARDRRIGRAPDDGRRTRAQERELERLDAERRAQRGTPSATPAPAAPLADPLAGLQWDMQAIRATPEGSYGVNQGSPGVTVGVMDTGVDGDHPDIAPNFDRDLSRNFTTDDPLVDGACAEDPDGSCTDPADADENGHGTHVAGTIASPLNGQGIGGVAPRARIVNLRAGQDSGYFFVQPTVDALTYAGDHGIDVVNMSFYIDPWLFNCAANPADSPEQQAEQRVIVEATQRALDYARERGVTLVAAAGNGNTDLGRPGFDGSSPDYPPGTEHDRQIDNATCLSMPTEGEGVISVTSTGPSGRKAYYSNYGTEQADVAAPGGDVRDFPGTERYRSPQNLVLAPYPKALAQAAGELDEAGDPTTPFVVRDGEGYYQYLQGTSMAAPHAAGVAALAVTANGRPDRTHGGLTASPGKVEQVLRGTAADTPCPEPRLFDYPDLDASYDATCEGTPKRNGFFGDGVVDALRAGAGR